MTDDSAKFKATMGEWEAESAYLLQSGETKMTKLRVFSDRPGLVRLDLQIVKDGDPGPAEHVQIVVGQEGLMKRLVEPQNPEQA
jgi:bifunctional ADP-heptose synthase (sugar kinase/adenylyltransferase)